jgi:hypothetical protein
MNCVRSNEQNCSRENKSAIGQPCAGASILFNHEFDFNEIDEGESQLYEDDNPRNSTVRAI